jgi:cysteine synthase
LPDVLNPKVFDQLLPVNDEEGKAMARRLAREEGIFVGISAGATVAAAVKVAEQAPAGSVLLAMLPDTGERYLGTYLFDDLNAGSDDEWLASLGKS